MNNNLLKTPLYDLHRELGARMVEFAGYQMPIQYPLGLMKEHMHTRDKAGLFDVSHMGQVIITGKNPAKELEKLVPVDVIGIKPFKQRYALFTNDQGGILDDLMISNAGDYLFVVVNAACKEQDISLMKSGLPNHEISFIEDRALLALQGPAAAKIMKAIAPETADMVFMDWRPMNIEGFDCFIGRAGYTGEDGFEISVLANDAEALAKRLLSFDEVEAIGLGARDSLRLESGLCLYGQDIDYTTSLVEAGLLWAMQKERRPGGERAGGYPGADIIETQLNDGTKRKRIGLQVDGRVPVRSGTELVDKDDRHIGIVTSGAYGPTLGAPIAMAYVDTKLSKIGTELFAYVRDKKQKVTVAKMPLVPQKYFRG